jgi:CBS domain-containing protein
MRIEALRPMTEARLVMVAIDTSLRRAAAALSDSRIGLLVVCDESRRAAGVVSKSDIVRHVTTMGAAEAPVVELMSRTLVACDPKDDLYATWKKMAAQSLQNLPVLGADAVPLGVLDFRDALKTLFEQEEYQERLLSNYIAGIGYQ